MKACIWCASLIAILFVSTNTFGAVHITGNADFDHSESANADADLEGGTAGAGADGDSPYNWAYAEGWKRCRTDAYGWFQVSWNLGGSGSALISLVSFEASSAAASGSVTSSGVLGGNSIPLSASVDSGDYQGDNPMYDSDNPDDAYASAWMQCYPDDAVSTSFGGAVYASVIEGSEDVGFANIDMTAQCSMN
jgi:hypothetical protein